MIPPIISIDSIVTTNCSKLQSEILKPFNMSPIPGATSSTKQDTANSSHNTVTNSRITKAHKPKKMRKGTNAGKTRPQVFRIIINNRLGTRAEILCSPSDTIGDFKKVAALYIGQPAGSIMLKRQGGKAMKDQLTLEDYEVSNGSSLDFELDTGD